jgi:hypothetical protein
MDHVHETPLHPQTQGKIDNWHQTLQSNITSKPDAPDPLFDHAPIRLRLSDDGHCGFRARGVP